MKKNLVLFISILGLLTLLAACGSGGGVSSQSTSTSSTSKLTTSTAASTTTTQQTTTAVTTTSKTTTSQTTVTSTASSTPAIPHAVDADHSDCLACHGASGVKPYPNDHSERALNTCTMCHTFK